MEDRHAEVALRYAEVARTFGAALERLAGGYERDPDARRDLLQDIHVASRIRVASVSYTHLTLPTILRV